MNTMQSLYLCYKGLARTRSTFRDVGYEKPGHVLLSTLSNEEVNKVLLNFLVRERSKVHFCVQLRIDDAISQRRYYVGIQKKGENICISHMHQVPFTPQ